MPKKPSEEDIPAQAVEESAPQEAPLKEARVKVRVLVNGARVAGGIAAKGKLLNVKLSEAKTLESLGKVNILGV
jgi:hypothetical protein